MSNQLGESQSNTLGMKRRSARENVAESQVLHAWHTFRNRKRTKKTNPDGSVTVSLSVSPGPTLKQWAKAEVKAGGTFAPQCKTWLENKTGKLEKEAMALRFQNKGAMNAQIAAATKLAKKSKKGAKTAVPKKEK